jgi:hypothetical protein
VSSLEHRIEKLEAGVEKKSASRWQIPPEVLVYTKMCERNRARTKGREPPEYSWEEIEEMRRQDLETVSGNGADASLRNSIGWQTPEAQRMLSEWQEDARRRLERAEGLPPERWGEVWGSEDEE